MTARDFPWRVRCSGARHQSFTHQGYRTESEAVRGVAEWDKRCRYEHWREGRLPREVSQ